MFIINLIVFDRDLSVKENTLSAIFKMKRKQITEVFNKEIESMYGDNPKISVR